MLVEQDNSVAIEQDSSAFPTLSDEEMRSLRRFARTEDYSDGQTVFKAGDAGIDFFVVESGKLDILNPADDNRLVVSHKPKGFAGDIDLLTRRPVVVTAVAHGPTRMLRVPAEKVRELLNRVPQLGEKLMTAVTLRRKLLTESDRPLGLKVIGPARCSETNLVREFLYKNFVPFNWYDSEETEGRRLLVGLGSVRKLPVVALSNGKVLERPKLQELAHAAGIWRMCPSRDVDLAIVGAGPSGIAAAVYAASEGLSTLVIDKLGPGGQVGGSSRIENFIGFPAGLTGTELATRGVLQMLKFGAQMVAPVDVQRLEPAASANGPHTLHLDCGSQIHAQSVLAASGIRWRKLEAEGADRFENAGVFYVCTSVETLLYDNEDVAVVGAGNSAGQAAIYLAECCRGRKVHMLVRGQLGPNMSEYLTRRIRAAENIVLHEGVEIAAVNGNRRIESLQLKDRQGNDAGPLSCAAVFVFIGADPACDWLGPQVARDRLGYLLTGSDALRSERWPLRDRDPCPLETTIPGVLAAGDIRAGSTKRVGFAVGDGSLAVTCTHFLRSLRV